MLVCHQAFYGPCSNLTRNMTSRMAFLGRLRLDHPLHKASDPRHCTNLGITSHRLSVRRNDQTATNTRPPGTLPHNDAPLRYRPTLLRHFGFPAARASPQINTITDTRTRLHQAAGIKRDRRFPKERLSESRRCTTLSAFAKYHRRDRFNFSVRNGKRWSP